jgi:hypothetical protein
MKRDQLFQLAEKRELIGLFEGIENEEYHRGPGESRSSLIEANRSIKHWQFAKTNPKETTKAMQEGSWFHELLMEPEKTEDWIEIDEGINWGTIKYEKLAKEAGGKTVVAKDVLARLRRQVDAAMSNAQVEKLMRGATEISGYWYSDGILCKTKPDKFFAEGRIICDFKTTQDASAREFAKSCVNFGYDMQGAMAIDGINEAIIQATKKKLGADPGTSVDSVVLVAVESSEPHGVALYALDPEAVSLGRMKYQRALEALKQYQASGLVAPGYPETIQTLMFPAWCFQ